MAVIPNVLILNLLLTFSVNSCKADPLKFALLLVFLASDNSSSSMPCQTKPLSRTIVWWDYDNKKNQTEPRFGNIL